MNKFTICADSDSHEYVGMHQKSEDEGNSGGARKISAVLGGCNDCHTPKIPGPEGAPVPDNTKLLSGHAANSPAPAWSPDDMKQKNVAATGNESLTAWAVLGE